MGQRTSSWIGALALVAAAAGVATLFLDAKPGPSAAPQARPRVPARRADPPPPATRPGTAGTILGRVLRDRDLRIPADGHAVTLLRDGASPRTSATDPWGRFEFDGVESGVAHEVRVDPAAEEPGGAPVRVPSLVVGAGERRNLDDLVLDPAGRFDVTVTDETGAPVAGAVVEAFREREFHGPYLADLLTTPVAIASAVTDADGRAALIVPRSDRCSVTARTEGTAVAAVSDVVCWRGVHEPLPVDIVLRRPAALAGRVLAADGAPVPRAAVLARRRPPVFDRHHGTREDGVALWQRTTADGSGRFTFSRLDPGETQFMAAAPGQMPQFLEIVRVPEMTTVELRLTRSATLTGRVTEEGRGAPLPGATVVVTSDVAGNAARATTDADGAYLLTGLPADTATDVTITPPPGWTGAAGPQWTASFREGETRRLDWTFRRAAVVRGRVTSDGAPVAGIDVRVSTLSESGDALVHTSECRTSVDGRYEAADVVPGAVVAFAAPPGLDPFETYGRWRRWTDAVRKDAARSAEEAFAAVPGGVHERDLAVAPPGPDEETTAQRHERQAAEMSRDTSLVTVRGRVTTGDGLPLLRAVLLTGLRMEHALGQDGRYEIHQRMYGDERTVTLRARDERHDLAAAEHVAVPPGATEVTIDLVLPALLAVRGRVVCDDAPVAGALVASGGVVVARSGPDGTFDVRLRRGVERLAVFAAGFVQAEPAKVEVPAGGVIDVEIDRERSVEGVVVDESGQPVAGAIVTPVEDDGDALRGSGRFGRGLPPPTDATGRFRVGGLSEGSVRLAVTAPQGREGALARTTLEVDAGAEGVLIVARPACRIGGRVLEAGGAPVRGARIALTRPGASARSRGRDRTLERETDGSGRFAFDDLPGGDWVASVRPPWDRKLVPPPRRTLTASAADAEFVLEPAPAITGVVLRPDGRAFERSRIEAVRIAGPKPDSDLWPWDTYDWTDEKDGTFRIVVPPGTRWRVEFGRGTSAVLRGGDDVAAGTTGLRLLADPALAVAGRCVTEDDAPLAKVEVELRTATNDRRWFRSRADGTFRFEGFAGPMNGELPESAKAGGVTLVFHAEGRVPVRRTGVAAGTEDVGVVLKPGLTVTGRLLAADGTPPPSTWKLRVLRPSSPGDDLWRAQPDRRGAFTMEGLDEGDWDFEAIVEGCNGVEKTVPLGRATAGARGVEFRMPAPK